MLFTSCTTKIISLVWSASCGPRCTSGMVSVPSLVSEEREGWVWMLMEVCRAWRREKE